MYKVSVIMPIFNAGKYLENTLNSVINQTIGFENIELILVDDCSTDNSRDIVEEYSSKYSNIKPIFLEENTGCPGVPRNVGIKNASSDYIMFIDNDDEYFPEICDNLYDTLISENADIVVCTTLLTKLDGTSELMKSRELKKVLLDKEIAYFDNVTVWNCIFKKSIILNNNISFVEDVFEDGIFILEYCIHSRKLVYLNDYLGYHYIKRTDSTSVLSLNREIGEIQSYYHCAKILEMNNYDLDRYFEKRIPMIIYSILIYDNYGEIKKAVSYLSDFERKINFNGNIFAGYNIINFFILRGNVNIATYIGLSMSKIRKCNLLLEVYRKFFLK